MAMDPAALSREADAAARRGDLPLARSKLAAAIEAGGGSLDRWLQLAGLSRATGDAAAALASVDRALALDPLHFVALLLRASLLEQLGKPAAGEAYGRALAQKPVGDLPPQLTAQVRYAETQYAAFQQDTNARLAAAASPALAGADTREIAAVARFRTNTARLTRTHHSEPTHYSYPGLAEREFHDRARFAWLTGLEAQTSVIAAEFTALVAAERAEMVPYIRYPENVPLRQWQALNHSRAWSAVHLIQNGRRIDANARHCPATMAALTALPQPVITGLSPNAMFSLLAPGARIPPHTGVANTRLVCHLPLIVSPDCWFRVGADRRIWERGKAWVFDDTIEHEAANEGSELRVILIVDVWHPDLSAREQAAVAAIVASFDAIDVAL